MLKLDWNQPLTLQAWSNPRSQPSKMAGLKRQVQPFHWIVLALCFCGSETGALAASFTSPQAGISSVPTLAPAALQLSQRRPRRPLRGRGGICVVSPGLLEAQNVVWSDRPLFLWRSKPEDVTLQRLAVLDLEGRILWEKSLAPADQGAIYAGQALQPGQFYQWRLEWTVQGTEDFADYTFQVMAADRRNPITTGLQALSQKLQASGASAEEIAHQQSDYLIAQPQPLWSDALKVLYMMENPSTATMQRIQDLTRDVCGEEENT